MSRTWLVIPCYNEATRLPADSIRDWLAATPNARVHLVDDGSNDGTAEVLRRLCDDGATDGRCTHESLPRNQGKAAAVRAGMLTVMANAEPSVDLIGYWDADLATPLDEVPRFEALFAEEPQREIVLGARVKLLGRRVDRKLTRHYIGRVFATIASNVLRLPIYDTQCGAKLFRATPRLGRILAEPFRTGWVFDVELLARWMIDLAEQAEPLRLPADPRIAELPLLTWIDVHGSKVKARHGIAAFWQLLRIAWRYRRRIKLAAPPPSSAE